MGHSTGALSSVEHKSVVTVLIKFSRKLNESNWGVKHGVCNFGCLCNGALKTRSTKAEDCRWEGNICLKYDVRKWDSLHPHGHVAGDHETPGFKLSICIYLPNVAMCTLMCRARPAEF